MVTNTTADLTQRSRFELARHDDDAELCRLLRDNPMDGDIRVTLERQPSCFAAAAIEGTRHDFIVARNPRGDRIQGFGSRSVYDAYVNGTPQTLGYLGQLRVDAGSPGAHGLVRSGYRLLQQLDQRDHDDLHRQSVPFYVTTIVSDNLRARRLLEKGIPGLPTYRKIGSFVTLLLDVNRGAGRRHHAACVERGPETFQRHRHGIADCLHRNLSRFQFARRWQSSELCSDSTPGLRPEDFCVAVHQGRVLGCLAVWDQRSFKQIVIRGYRRRIAWSRPVFNLLAPALGVPRLPRVGSTLDVASLSHLAVDDDDTDCFGALLDAALLHARQQRIGLLTLGLAHGHPLLDWVRNAYPHRTYESIIYVVHWGKGTGLFRELDDRVPHLEVATL